MEFLPKACINILSSLMSEQVVLWCGTWFLELPKAQLTGVFRVGLVLLEKVINFRKNDVASWFVGIGGGSVPCADVNNAPHVKHNQ